VPDEPTRVRRVEQSAGAAKGGADSSALRQALRLLNAALADARRRLGADARPPVAALEAVGRQAEEARRALAELAEAAAGLPEGERLELMREAAAARARLAVVAKLAGGAAWFASLARELDGSPRGGLYGRGGTADEGTPPRSVERKA